MIISMPELNSQKILLITNNHIYESNNNKDFFVLGTSMEFSSYILCRIIYFLLLHDDKTVFLSFLPILYTFLEYIIHKYSMIIPYL